MKTKKRYYLPLALVAALVTQRAYACSLTDANEPMSQILFETVLSGSCIEATSNDQIIDFDYSENPKNEFIIKVKSALNISPSSKAASLKLNLAATTQHVIFELADIPQAWNDEKKTYESFPSNWYETVFKNSYGCALRIGDNVTLKNIIVRGFPADGICVVGKSVVLDDIKIENNSGYGLVIKDAAKGNVTLKNITYSNNTKGTIFPIEQPVPKNCPDGSKPDAFGACAKTKDKNEKGDPTDCDEGYVYDGDFEECVPEDEDDGDDEDTDDSENVTCLSAEILINGTCYANTVKKPITPPAFFPPTLPPTTNQTAGSDGGGGCSLMVRP